MPKKKKEPEVPTQQVRWELVSSALEKINNTLYDKILTYNEIDLILNILYTRTMTNKVVDIALDEIKLIQQSNKNLELIEKNKYSYIK